MRGLIISGSIVLACLLPGWPSNVRAQAGGEINLFTDADYDTCWLDDTAQGGAAVYVVHQRTPGAKGVRFKLVSNPGFGGGYLAESSPHEVVGSAPTGADVRYGGCLPSNILVMTVWYFMTGLSEDCSYLDVVPHPADASGVLEVTDCNDNTVAAGTHRMWVDITPACFEWCQILPVEHSTWGLIKALYED